MTDTMMKPQGEDAVKLSAWDKATAALEGIYASKTIHLAPEPQGDRSGLSEPGKMVFPEQAIAQARNGDYREIERLRRCLARPFDEQAEFADLAEPPPEGSIPVCVSCSS